MYHNKINRLIYLFLFAVTGTVMIEAVEADKEVEVEINENVDTIRVKLYSSEEEIHRYGNSNPPSFDPKNAIYFYARNSCVNIKLPKENRPETLAELTEQILTAIGLGKCCCEEFKENLEAIKVYRYDGRWLPQNLSSFFNGSSYRRKVANILLGKAPIYISEDKTLLTLILPENYFQVTQDLGKEKVLAQGIDLLNKEKKVIGTIERAVVVKELMKFTKEENSKKLLLDKNWTIDGSKNNDQEGNNTPPHTRQQVTHTSTSSSQQQRARTSTSSSRQQGARTFTSSSPSRQWVSQSKISSLVIGFSIVSIVFFLYMKNKKGGKKKKKEVEEDYLNSW